ncbi:hypothetical protein [Hylemonella gracilis]|uniref:hypothetical protein n=1 Tax=Hylemonella gracilis TaxID=80880 RepID=UPI00103A278F|nr:hypothetical protein [Hylemonella gracilis]
MLHRPTIIIRDEKEARVVQRQNLRRGARLLTFTPAAAAVFGHDSGHEVIRSSDIYNDHMHAQTVMHLKNGLLEFERLARQQGLTDTQVEAGRCAYFHELGIGSFFYQSLQGLEEIHWVDSNGVLQRANTPQEAFETVFGEMSRARLSTLDPLDLSWMHRMLIRLNGFCIRLLLANRKKLLIIDGVRPSSHSFSIAARKHDSALAVLETPRKPLKTSSKPSRLCSVPWVVPFDSGEVLLPQECIRPPTFSIHIASSHTCLR